MRFCLNPSTTTHRRRRRGAALLLVLFALMSATVLAMTFVGGSATSVAIAGNIDRHAQARAIAESGLEVAMLYVQTDADWRTNQTHGDWLVDESFGGGTFTIRGEDDDGNLADDATDIVRLIAVGRFDGVSHRIEAEATPGTTAAASNMLLFVVADASSLKTADSAKKTQFESWGYTVSTISDNDSSTAYNTALTSADVVYVAESSNSGTVGTKLSSTAVGVVCEEGRLTDELKVSSSRSTYKATQIDIVDNTHAITSEFSTGTLTIGDSKIRLQTYTGTIGTGVTSLAEKANSSSSTLSVLDTGDTDYQGNASPGRRVMLPWGPTRYGFDDLTDDGLTLIQRSLEWAGGGAGAGPTPKLIALYEFEPVSVTPVLIGHWKLDESLSNGGGGMAADDSLELRDRSVVDSYDGSTGLYGGTNVGSQANLSTNSTSSNRFDVKTNATLNGNAIVGVGGDPDSVIDHDGTITGSKSVLDAAVAMPDFGAPTGTPSTLGNTTYSTDQTWTSDLTFGRLTIKSSAEITVSGHVRVYCTNTFKVEDNAKIIVPSGSSLTIFVNRNILIQENAVVNGDSSGTSRLKIVQIASNKDVVIKGDAVVSAIIQARRDITIRNDAVVYGSLIADDDIYVRNNARVHLDVSLPTLGAAVMPAIDQIAANDGTYTNGTIAGSTGNGLGGTAANFDGSNDYIEIPHSDDYLLEQGAVSLWFYADRLTGRQELFSKDSTNFDTGGHLTIYLDGSTLKTRLQSSTASYDVSEAGLQTATWYHAVFTWGPGGMELFLDGVSVDSENYVGGLGVSSGDIGNSEPIALGGNTWQSGDGSVTPIQDHFDGRIDDVRLYDKRLIASQAAEIKSGSAPSAAVSAVAFDTSSFGDALDLAIDDASAVSWITGGGLEITSDVAIVSTLAATKLYDALNVTDELAIEVVFTPANLTQDGPAGLVSYSASTSTRNFTVGQDDDEYLLRLRTTDTSSNGTPNIESGSVLTANQQQHVIVTFKGEEVLLYRGDTADHTAERTGDLSAWDSTMKLILGNELDGSRPWHGKLHRVAIYDRGFNALQATNVFDGSEPGNGFGTGGDFKVVWDENP